MNPFLSNNRGLIFVLVALCIYLWIVPLQTQDGPNHKIVAVTLERIQENPQENEIYRNQLGPFTTNSLFPLVYIPASRFLTPDQFEKIFIAFFLMCLVITYKIFLKVWDPPNATLWVLILPVCFHPLFIRGMFNFLASVPLTLLALTLLFQGLRTSQFRYFLGFLLTTWITFLAHPFPFFVLSICIVLLGVGEFRKKLAQIALYLFPVLLFLGIGFILPLFQSDFAQELPSYSFHSIPNILGGIFAFNFVAYSYLETIFYVPFFGILLALMVYSFIAVPWKYKAFWMAMLLGYLVFPDEGKGGAHLGQRFLPYITIFLPIGIQLSLGRVRVIQGFSAFTAVFSAVILILGMSKVYPITQGAKTALAALPNYSRLYPINFDHHGPGLTYTSLMHLWGHYDTQKTIYSPYLFSYLKLMPLSRRLPSSPTYFPSNHENFPVKILQNNSCSSSDSNCRARRNGGYQTILKNASYYDYWFIYQPPEDFIKYILDIPGIQKIAEENGSSLWRYENSKPFDPPLPRQL